MNKIDFFDASEEANELGIKILTIYLHRHEKLPHACRQNCRRDVFQYRQCRYRQLAELQTVVSQNQERLVEKLNLF